MLTKLLFVIFVTIQIGDLRLEFITKGVKKESLLTFFEFSLEFLHLVLKFFGVGKCTFF